MLNGQKEYRVEKDFLGEKQIEADVYYGIQTLRASENFPITGYKIHEEMINALAIVKKAAALANMDVKRLYEGIGQAIVQAADEILEGKWHDQFIVDPIQGGAGTSMNMNANEVIGNRALEIMGHKKGDYIHLSPNTHVNMSQSTNDVFPTAIHISTLKLLEKLLKTMEDMHSVFKQKAQEFDSVIKMGRTHLQDAVPIRLGQEFEASLKKELDSVGKDVAVEAANVSQIRKTWAKKLADEIHRELKSLYMEKSTFDTEFKVRTASRNEEAPLVNGQPVQLTEQGIDLVKFLISTNTGEPLKSLSKVASGGELSRVMLAIKSIFSSQQDVTSIIFDEVDTGVSGRVAQAIAEKIHKVSIGSQVLCITHLPQVAAMADTHLYIAKELKDGRTTTRVKPLSKQEKVAEIGRMIAGVEVTDLTKRHAKELLKQADQVKTTG